MYVYMTECVVLRLSSNIKYCNIFPIYYDKYHTFYKNLMFLILYLKCINYSFIHSKKKKEILIKNLTNI